MRRRSERSKPKTTPKEEQSPEKSTRKTHKHSRKRRKSSSSSEDNEKSPQKEVELVSAPVDFKVQDIELPQGEKPDPVVANNVKETAKKADDVNNEWKEDSSFWQSETKTVEENPNTETNKDKEESSLWKVQSANGAGGGGEIQKLKICRQRPTESPEIGEASLNKRLSRGPRDSRSTDDSTQEESEKESKKSKHRTRTSSRNSPLVSPTVVLDMSGDSPTKIKILNVYSHLNAEKAGTAKTGNDDPTPNENLELKSKEIAEDNQTSDTLEIALPPSDETIVQATLETESEERGGASEEPLTAPASNVQSSEINVDTLTSHTAPKESVEEKSTSRSASPEKEEAKLPPSKSSGDSESSEDESKPRKTKKKSRRELQSAVQRKLSTSTSPKQESSDSEDDKQKKKEDSRRDSTDNKDDQDANNKENEAVNSISNKEDKVEESKEKNTPLCPMPRKRRWGSSKSNRSDKKPVLNISTDSLKSLIPDAKPIPAEELQLSVEEEEEGQLIDDDDEEDEVVALVAKEEEKELEQERQREEKQKEREKEFEERRKRKERLDKSKPELFPSSNSSDKGAASRKILLLTDEAKKLARSPSPPRRKPTNVLFITNLVRPFTVQQLKNLLLRTGTIEENGFWIDKIKSKCYVEYTTEDAAIETRHALHGVKWPTSNPKTLSVEFASHDDLIMAQTLSEEPEVPRKMEPLNMVEGWVADQARIKDRNRRAVVREWDVGKPEHPDEILEYELKKEKRELERKARKEQRAHRSPSQEPETPARKTRRKEEDAPAKLLDDLFRKTKTSPCIYWLPLTPEQIAVKEEIRRQHMAEHERRMAELKKVELARRDRERRNRK